MITVTDFELSPDSKRATILISVFPDHKGLAALDFANRRSRDLREHIKANLKLRQLPSFQFLIDEGEKHRQKVEELLK